MLPQAPCVMRSVPPNPLPRVLDQNGIPLPVAFRDVLSCPSLAAALELVSTTCGRRCFQLVLCHVADTDLTHDALTSAITATPPRQRLAPLETAPESALQGTLPSATITITPTPTTTASGSERETPEPGESPLPFVRTSSPVPPTPPRCVPPAGPPLKAVAACRLPFSTWPPPIFTADAPSNPTSPSRREAVVPQARQRTASCPDGACVVCYALLVDALRTPSVSSSPAASEELTLSPGTATELAATPSPPTRQLMLLVKSLHSRAGRMLFAIMEHYAGREAELLDEVIAAAHPLWTHPRWQALVEQQTQRVRMQRQAECVMRRLSESLSEPISPLPLPAFEGGRGGVAGLTTRPAGLISAQLHAQLTVRRWYFDLLSADSTDGANGAMSEDVLLTKLESKLAHTAIRLPTPVAARTEVPREPRAASLSSVTNSPPFPSSNVGLYAGMGTETVSVIVALRQFLQQSPGAETALRATTLTEMDTRRRAEIQLLQNQYALCLQKLRRRWVRGGSGGALTDDGPSPASVAWLKRSGAEALTLSTSLATKLLRGAGDEPTLPVDMVEYMVFLVYERLWERFTREHTAQESGHPTRPAARTPPFTVSPRRRERLQHQVNRVREESAGALLPWRRHVEEMVRLRQVPVETVLLIMSTILRDPNAIASLVLHPQLDVRQTLTRLCHTL